MYPEKSQVENCGVQHLGFGWPYPCRSSSALITTYTQPWVLVIETLTQNLGMRQKAQEMYEETLDFYLLQDKVKGLQHKSYSILALLIELWGQEYYSFCVSAYLSICASLSISEGAASNVGPILALFLDGIYHFYGWFKQFENAGVLAAAEVTGVSMG